MKTLNTPNKKIVYDIPSIIGNDNSSKAIDNKKIKIEMTYDQAKELLERPESNRTIILPNGTKVGLTEAGDPNGTPAIMMSGMGMHSRKYALLLNNYGLRYKVKIIGFDRPNIDGSDPIYFKESKKSSKKNSKKIKNIFRKSSKTSIATSCSKWVEGIIDVLGIKRCHLMSLCIGGLYVMGCVKYFKHPEKIASPLYLIAPWVTPKKCVLPVRFVDTFVPTSVIRAAMSCYYRTIGLMVPSAQKNPNAIMFKLVHVDEKADPLGGRRLLFSKILKSGFFKNETKHLCHDDWELGFGVNPNNKLDFSTIEKDVIIYHGTKDKLIPAKSSKYLVKKWNSKYKAELHIKKGKDHSTIKGSCLHDIFNSINEHSLNNSTNELPVTIKTTNNIYQKVIINIEISLIL
ncbi:hypothetical protein H8356DRAFT_1275801 [Neocallimastix lanati (nom. inval.)]|uniref:Alpha/beta-hydrolase n=1 Tax=Neocallimastix californiae TaxID=1754190 RepID=A0A1Y2DZJ7_9FUNG|nr:hypothetical protein H8356DRAFT_1275801 [Neocallimastix sp. JGI-2020a]ORY64667.1 hypothetical protein LY90DRAFT_668052 [Neocallimastix californiae]|eukprot:ORY64667.1 hypothetical protein LY90DRAFT_668052 [Neocallimastix californiae]